MFKKFFAWIKSVPSMIVKNAKRGVWCMIGIAVFPVFAVLDCVCTAFNFFANYGAYVVNSIKKRFKKSEVAEANV